MCVLFHTSITDDVQQFLMCQYLLNITTVIPQSNNAEISVQRCCDLSFSQYHIVLNVQNVHKKSQNFDMNALVCTIERHQTYFLYYVVN